MLTVKVTKQARDQEGNPIDGRFSTKIVETEQVDIHTLKVNELYEVAGGRGDNGFCFFIASRNKPRPEGFSNDVVFWCSAYIENSKGSTVESIYL